MRGGAAEAVKGWAGCGQEAARRMRSAAAEAVAGCGQRGCAAHARCGAAVPSQNGGRLRRAGAGAAPRGLK